MKFRFVELPLPPHHHDGPCECAPTVGYIRVSSTKKQRKNKGQILSPREQLEQIMEDARKHNRWVTKLYFDIDKSGTTLEGRKILEIIAEMKAGKYRSVTVWKWSRWGRNTLESLTMCNMVDEAGGLVYSATEAFDTTTPTGEMIRDMLLVQAAWQSKLIGESWTSAHKFRREAGLPHTGRERFGYLYIDRQYVILEDEANLLRDAYERYVEGASLYQLVVEWNAAGMTTMLGGQWTPQGLGKMLDTGFAAGYIRERSQPAKARQKGARNAGNKITHYDVWRKGSQDAIITEELWQRYRAKREERASLPPRLREPVHELSGLMFCELDGRRITTRYVGRSRTHSWYCTHRPSYHSDANISISNATALEVVRNWVRETIAEDDRSASVASRSGELEADAPQVDTDIDRCMRLVEQIATRKGRLRSLYVDGLDPDMDEIEYKRRLAGLLAEEQAARVELARAKAAESKIDRAALLPAFMSVDEHWDDWTTNERHAALAEIVGMVLVSTPASRKPADSLLRVKVVPAWEMSEWGDAWLADRRR